MGKQIIDKLLSISKFKTVVNIANNGERLTRFANSEIHQNVEIDDAIISLSLWDGKKSATSSTNAYDDAALEKLMTETEAMLSFAPEGEYEYVATPPQGEIAPAINDERIGQKLDIKGRAEVLKRCIDTLPADFTAAGALSINTNLGIRGDCDKNFYYNSFDYVSFDVVVTHKDGDTGHGAASANNLDGADIDAAFARALEKAKMAIGPVYADLGAYTVVLEPAAVANLLMYALFGLNGASYDKGMGYAAGRLGEKIFGDNFTIKDDINNPHTFQRKADAEGRRRQPVDLFTNGVLQNVLYCNKTAKKAGKEPTGHALGSMWGAASEGGLPMNIIMQGGDSNLADMIAGVERGILVTHFHYCNTVNPKTLQITGLTRDGTFLIENGKISKPLCNMRFTESLLNAFSNIKVLSKELTPAGMFGGVALLPSVVIENFHFTSGQK